MELNDLSPSSVLFDDMKNYGKINHNTLAVLLFKKDAKLGKTLMHERLKSRSFISRNIKFAVPGYYPKNMYNNFVLIALALTNNIKKQTNKSYDEIIEHYKTEASEQMCEALEAVNIDSTMYKNIQLIIENLSEQHGISTADKCTAYVLLFVATGALGDLQEVDTIVNQYVNRSLNVNYYTTAVRTEDLKVLHEDKETNLALQLLRSKSNQSGIFPIAKSSTGTIIGFHPKQDNDVIIVNDSNVSREHLKVYYDEASEKYFVLGLNSTNGTKHIDGGTSIETVIDLPRAQTDDSYIPSPHEIKPSDRLILGETTVFWVIATN